MSQWQVQQQVAKKDYSCMYQRIHCKPSWSFQQILSQTKEEMFMPVKKVLQCIVQIGCPTQMNGIDCGLFAVMNCSHIFDGVAINPSILLKNILLDYARFSLICWVARRMQHDF